MGPPAPLTKKYVQLLISLLITAGGAASQLYTTRRDQQPNSSFAVSWSGAGFQVHVVGGCAISEAVAVAARAGRPAQAKQGLYRRTRRLYNMTVPCQMW